MVKRMNFKRSIIAFFPAPLTDQEIHRHQSDLPKNEEDQQIQAHKYSQHACFQQQEQDHEGFNVFLDIKSGQDGQRG